MVLTTITGREKHLFLFGEKYKIKISLEQHRYNWFRVIVKCRRLL